MPFLAGNLIWTSRASRTATGLTLVEQAYLSKVPAHVQNNTPNAAIALPDVAFKADYYMVVDSGTDIVEGDLIIKITLRDGVTPWPAIRPGPRTQMPGVPGASNLLFRVVYSSEMAAVFLPAREVWFDYIQGGGPA
jgi:hypothetical protein